MSPYAILQAVSLPLNLLGLVLCLVGLTLAQRRHRRALGYGLAAGGFLIAASPMLLQLFGLVPPPPEVLPSMPR